MIFKCNPTFDSEMVMSGEGAEGKHNRASGVV